MWVDHPAQDLALVRDDEYPFLAQLSVPDQLRLAAFEARDLGVPVVHIRVILDAAETLEGLIDWLETRPKVENPPCGLLNPLPPHSGLSAPRGEPIDAGVIGEVDQVGPFGVHGP